MSERPVTPLGSRCYYCGALTPYDRRAIRTCSNCRDLKALDPLIDLLRAVKAEQAVVAK